MSAEEIKWLALALMWLGGFVVGWGWRGMTAKESKQ